MEIDVKTRFTKVVNEYEKYRPGYPAEAVGYLTDNGIVKDSIIAEAGSGTGIFTELIIDKCKHIYAIEPNDEMRSIADLKLKNKKNYSSVDAVAENTTLKTSSIDFIIAAQSFHWFDIEVTMNEFKRILKENGKLILIWNRRIDDKLFMRQYEEIIKKYSRDYNKVNHRLISDEIIEGLFKSNYKKKSFANYQEFDLQGLVGRMSSSSYSLKKEDDGYDVLIEELKELFIKHEKDGKIRFDYNTEIYSGSL